MKKEISPAAIICIIVGLVAAVGVGIFFIMKSDPAAQGPHEPPRFDPAAREAAEARNQHGGGSQPGAPPPGPGSNSPTIPIRR